MSRTRTTLSALASPSLALISEATSQWGVMDAHQQAMCGASGVALLDPAAGGEMLLAAWARRDARLIELGDIAAMQRTLRGAA